jgi:hypothetical protein
VVRIRPLPRPVDTSAGVLVVADAPHSFPCRRCLRDAEPGEEMLLVGYDPFEVSSPYTGLGPIYVHGPECAAHVGDEVPEQQRRRLLSVRGYDAGSLMTGAVVVPGTELDDAAAELFADDRTAFVHVHNAGPGCFAVRLDRDAV